MPVFAHFAKRVDEQGVSAAAAQVETIKRIAVFVRLSEEGGPGNSKSNIRRQLE